MKSATFGLRAKTMLGSLLPVTTVVILAVLSLVSVQKLLSSFTDLDRTHQAIEKGMSVEICAIDLRSALGAYLSTGEESSLQAFNDLDKEMNKLFSSARHTSQDAIPGLVPEQTERLYQTWRKDFAAAAIEIRRGMGPAVNESGKAGIAGKPVEASGKLESFLSKGEDKRLFDQFRKATEDFVTREERLLPDLRKAAGEGEDFAWKAVLWCLAACLLIVFVKNYVMVGRTTKPLTDAVRVAEAISRGELTQRVDVKKNDEMGRLGAALNRMVEILQRQTRRIIGVVDVLSSSTATVSSSVSQLSATTSRTAEAIAEATATVEEMLHAARLSSEKAKDVARTCQDAVQMSESGLTATDDTVRRMRVIKQQMDGIGETVMMLSENTQSAERVIGAVQDLADQSNLLAVNASIEAARAGDQGKGFAVVAQEIKALADQSRQATQEVQGILADARKWVTAVAMATEQAAKAVDAGVTESTAAGEAIRSLAASVGASAQAATVIEAANQQQFTGVEQVSDAMRYIEQGMRENVAGTSQIENATRELRSLGESLKDLIKGFRV